MRVIAEYKLGIQDPDHLFARRDWSRVAGKPVSVPVDALGGDDR